jgi:hypothetical protein
MIPKIFSNTLNSFLRPNAKEIREAQEQTIARIQGTLLNAESEVASKGQFMTDEQRLNAAENELKNTEEHLLSALGSLFKAACYVSPQFNQLIKNIPITQVGTYNGKRAFRSEKIIDGEVVE